MKLLILGATGMLGSQLLRSCLNRGIDVSVLVRNKKLLHENFPELKEESIYLLDDIKDFEKLEKQIAAIGPQVVVNCIGIVKQSQLANNAFESISINTYLPHLLSQYAGKYQFQLIHISTDCVFDGAKGNYSETDNSNATDLYGKSKYLGEVYTDHAVTLRTSIIGHELTATTFGLLEWFLSQQHKTNGYSKAIFSGFTTNELSKIILDVVIPQKLTGSVYNVAAAPISKYDLLKIMAVVYKKDIEIVPSEALVIDRSLNGSKFKSVTGYSVPSWPAMISEMYSDYSASSNRKK
ncbi:SDR family oxidoreductase [Lacibacter sp.]|uniref:dTDP-4-dehydrorhamnose reductase family protein n=1 Tax=Lacibacter sp. TaxID=1915409 RepID=UPI002B4B7871|nr:SDR family oxidoreductase [Lacibacter sp.]HLP36102.1 SDR family oxidoreductase [Lacibacter sp.]